MKILNLLRALSVTKFGRIILVAASVVVLSSGAAAGYYVAQKVGLPIPVGVSEHVDGTATPVINENEVSSSGSDSKKDSQAQKAQVSKGAAKKESKVATPNAKNNDAKATSPSVPSSNTPGGSSSGSTTPESNGTCVGQLHQPGGPDGMGGCWPGPHNTGYPKGLAGDTRTPVSLTNYTGPQEITSCGVTINAKVTSWLYIRAGNGTHSKNTPCVTIKNSHVRGTIFSDDPNAGPVLIEDTEVDSDGDLPYIENIGRYNYFTYRVNSHGGQGVIKCAAYCETKDNWIHGMTLGGQYHYNAIGGNGMEAGSWNIEHNWASCGDWESVKSNTGSDAGCSAVIGFYGDFAPVRNITINKNFLRSTYDMSSNGIDRQAGYCINPGYYGGKPYPDTTNVAVTNNVFSRGGSNKCGVFGPSNSLNAIGRGGTNVWTNNKYTDGTLVGRVEE